MRVGILGGVFNPPHIAHLLCAQEAVAELGLETALLMPAREAPHRDIELDPGAEARLEMCELAVADDERLAASRVELDRPGPSYTADTLRALRERSPQDELFLILGGDQAAELPSWHEPEEVFRLATVAAVEREGARRDEIQDKLAGLAGAEGLRFFDMPRVDVSSTLVRTRAAMGRPIRYLVPDKVEHFVKARKLYEEPAPVRVP
ncbi:MAG: nicotinate-nucleotide adenylyltransferase [Actinomycetota bacterium]|nr:nicotinate-nucleotide adenylyltransferase [Actinomycetota bacterium]